MSGIWSWFGFGGPQHCYHVHGKRDCMGFQKARVAVEEIKKKHPGVKVDFKEVSPEEWKEHLASVRSQLGPEARFHSTCPLVFEGCTTTDKKYVGTSGEFIKVLNDQYH